MLWELEIILTLPTTTRWLQLGGGQINIKHLLITQRTSKVVKENAEKEREREEENEVKKEVFYY